MVRTTLTLEDDVAEELKARAREEDLSFKQVVNDALRAGLASTRPPRRPYRMTTSDMGLHPGVNLVKALQFAAELENEEILRKLEQGR